MKQFNKFIEESSKKRCPPGQYYCFDEKKCKKTPKGYHIGGRGYLERDDEETNGNGGNGGNGGPPPVTAKDIEAIIAKAPAGPVQTIRIEQAPLKITTDDKPYQL